MSKANSANKFVLSKHSCDTLNLLVSFFLFRSYYIMCMVAITFLNLIGIPIEIAFLDGQGGVGWEGFNVFSDTLFLVDVGLNFRMGIVSEDNEVNNII